MKILILAHTAVLGGASRSLTLVVEQLRQAGCPVTILAPRGPNWAAWQELGAEVIEWSPPICVWLGSSIFSTYTSESAWDRLVLNISDLVRLPIRLLRSGSLIRKLLRNSPDTTIYINSLALFPLANSLKSLRAQVRVRVLWQIREVLNEELPRFLYSGIALNLARASDHILAISSHEARAFQSHLPVEIIHNSVPREWRDAVAEQPAGRSPVIAMASAFRPSKGVNDFIMMAELVGSKFPATQFLLYSPHPVPPRFRSVLRIARQFFGLFSEKIALSLELTEIMTEGVLQNRVHLILDRAVDLDVYRTLTVYVRADRSASPWGRDIIEAMWAGVPVVATGTSQEFVLDGKTGYLIPPGRPDLLAERVNQLLANPELRRSMSLASKVRAHELFDPDKYGTKLRRVFGLDTSVSPYP